MLNLETRNIYKTQKNRNVGVEFEIKKLDDLIVCCDEFGRLHKHDFYFLLFITSGVSKHIVDFNEETIKTGQILFMYPGQIHSFEYEKGTTGFTMYFTNGFLNNPNSSVFKIHQSLHTKSQLISLNSTNIKAIKLVFENLYDEFNASLINKKEMLRAYTELLLTQLLRQIVPIKYQYHLQSQNYFFKLIDLQEQYFQSNKEIKTISQDIGLSPKKLNKISRTYFGKTFLRLLNERKLLEVKRLLKTSDFSIKEIAYLNGFSDSAHLNNFFKKNIGITPLQFKKGNY